MHYRKYNIDYGELNRNIKQQVDEYEQNGEGKKAISFLKRNHNLYPDNYYIEVLLGMWLGKYNDTIDEGKEILKNYLKKEKSNINDNMGLFELAKLEIASGNFEEGQRIFYNLIEARESDTYDIAFVVFELVELCFRRRDYFEAIRLLNMFLISNLSDDFCLSGFLIRIKMFLISAYINTENHEEAYRLFSELNLDKKQSLSIREREILIVLNKHLNILSEQELTKKFSGVFRYFEKQILDYNRFLQHEKKHYKCIPKKNHGLFFEDIDINELLYAGGEFLDLAGLLPHYNDGLTDKYIIEYDKNVGKANSKETDLVSVVTLSNTNKIITMFPVEKDLVYYISKSFKRKTDVDREPSHTLVKRPSALEKFNKKYSSLV